MDLDNPAIAVDPEAADHPIPAVLITHPNIPAIRILTRHKGLITTAVEGCGDPEIGSPEIGDAWLNGFELC